jgi:hypothetical protein
MTQGILLFAHNNGHLNYGLMATWQAQRIKKFLGKPVSLVTDRGTIKNLRDIGIKVFDHFDQVLLSDASTKQQRMLNKEWVAFKNVDRVHAYELSPYDETLVIDTDILIQSDRLNTVWNNQEDLLVLKDSTDSLGRKFDEFEFVKDQGIEFYWATECYFKKSETARVFFETCKNLKENYRWYSLLYGLPGKLLRNDYIWSIALHELGGIEGATWASRIPRTLMFSVDRDTVHAFTDNTVTLGGKLLNGDYRVVQVDRQDVHIMNKFDLMTIVNKEMGIDQ